MWFYVAVLTLIILNCIGFYKDKIMIWSVPVVFIALVLCTMFFQYFMSEYSSFFAMISEYGIKTIYEFPFQIFVMSMFGSLITAIIRYSKSKKKLSNFQKTKEE